ISKSSFQNVLRCRGALGVARQGRRERSYAVHMGATEDAASRRSARPGDTRFILKGALSARDQDVFEELAGPAAGAAVHVPAQAQPYSSSRESPCTTVASRFLIRTFANALIRASVSSV